MKTISHILVVAAAALTLMSCSEKKSNTIIITKKKESTAKKPCVRKMGDYSQTTSVAWLDKKYTIESKLSADSSLPQASDGFNKYYDNQILLRVLRPDGTEFFSKTFTKEYFKAYVDNIYYKNGALLGIVFVKAEGRHLLFAASIGNPDKSSDEYVPLVLSIDNFGNVAISKDNKLDTDSQAAEDDEDGV